MIPHDLHYLLPSGVYFLFGAIVIGIIFWRLFFFRLSILKKYVIDPKLLSQILVPRSRYVFWFKVIALCLTWVFATLALMQPQGNGRYPLESEMGLAKTPKEKEKEALVKRKAHEVIFLVDASASMSIKDTRTGVARLDFAKEIVDEVMSRLRGESVSLYAFTSDTTKLSPSTMDYLFVRLMLRQLGINEGEITGTNLIEALADMREQHFSVQTPKTKTLILFTDGGDTQLEAMKGKERENHLRSILQLIADAEQHQLRVFTVGMGMQQGSLVPGITFEGKPVTSTLDEELLEKLSQNGRGKYYFANRWSSMDLAEDLITKIQEEEPSFQEVSVMSRPAIAKGGEDLVYDLYFQLPLSMAIILLGVVLTLPDSRVSKEKS